MKNWWLNRCRGKLSLALSVLSTFDHEDDNRVTAHIDANRQRYHGIPSIYD